MSQWSPAHKSIILSVDLEKGWGGGGDSVYKSKIYRFSHIEFNINSVTWKNVPKDNNKYFQDQGRVENEKRLFQTIKSISYTVNLDIYEPARIARKYVMH